MERSTPSRVEPQLPDRSSLGARGGAAVVALVTGALGLAGCSAGPAGHGAETSTSLTRPAPTSSPATTTVTAPTTSNLVVSDEIRSQLVAEGAALNSLPPSAYTGLVPGETYYAYDSSTKIYWAGGGLVPSSASTQAQVSTQDDGAYLLFERPDGRSWQAYAVGLAGTPGANACPVTVPAAILRLWNWSSGSCRPTTIS